MSATFPLHALLTLSTGRCWGPFGEAHRLAEHLMGHPVWTHELPSLAPELKRRVLESAPMLASITESEIPTSPDDADYKLRAQIAKFGDVHSPPAGTSARTRSPFDTLSDAMNRHR